MTSPLRLQSFLGAMAKPLPVTFRLRRTLTKTDCQELQETLNTKEYSTIVKSLPFGNHLLYQATNGIAKSDLKKHPHFKEWLVRGSLQGRVARQELGSMLPVLALEHAGAFSLQTRKRLKVLDVCASPGSKTLQALELLLGLQHSSQKQKSRILANDVSESRLTSLREAIGRSGVPLQYSDGTNIIGYSCADARHLSTTTNNNSKKPSQWDVIICDVPCSGDGTIRKDPHILELWKPSQGQALHSLQVQILVRALQLVRPCCSGEDGSGGGTICYSTCSLNPVENEAVVWEALRQYNGNAKKSNPSRTEPAAEIISFPTIPGFTRRPGITTWRVADYQDDTRSSNANETSHIHIEDEEEDETPKLVWYDTHEDAEQAGMTGALPSMWPPSTAARSDKDGMDLTRCTRLWPQDHDSGGFFLTLIRRNW